MSPSIDSLTLWSTVALAITLSLAAKRLAVALGKPQAAAPAASAKTPSAVPSSFSCCPICLEAIDGAECRLECGHVFHETCLKRWFQAGGAWRDGGCVFGVSLPLQRAAVAGPPRRGAARGPRGRRHVLRPERGALPGGAGCVSQMPRMVVTATGWGWAWQGTRMEGWMMDLKFVRQT
eukprot:Skav233403  [mRNA]  locus=scaffold892:47284:48274:- [translate_table: standard]